MADTKILDIILRVKDEATASLRELTAGAGKEIDNLGEKSVANGNKMKMGLGIGAAAVAVGVAGIGIASIHAAANFQEAMTSMVTGAGESESNIKAVSAGVLKLAGDTGTSTKQLTDGLYMIESAGFHGAAGLSVLKASAEGAKVGNADLGVVANAVTSTLNAYHLSGTKATAITNEMVATVASGKMHFQDLASSISNVLPVAAAAHISFDQVGGAIATMTMQGVSADQATQNIANTIRSLQNPSSIATKAMAAMGLSSTDLAQNLGKKGLTGTLEEITTAITTHMGKDGLVLQDAFNQSKFAAADAVKMMNNLPASVQGSAKALLAGSISAKDWAKDISGLDPIHKKMAANFATTATKAHGFNDALKKGGPDAKTFSAQLSDMTGGATGLNTSLLLTGGNLETFKSNVATVGEAAKKTGEHVSGWDLVQKDFNTKMSQAKESLSATGIAIGSALLPAATAALKLILDIVKPIAEWVNGHKALSAALLITVGAIATAVVTILTISAAMKKAKQSIDIVKDGVGTLSKAFKEGGIVTKIWTGIQAAFNAVMDANPIAIIILAIIALIAIIVLVVMHWKTVSKVAEEVWHDVTKFMGQLWKDVQQLFVAGINWIKGNWEILAAILLLPLAPLLIAWKLFHKEIMDGFKMVVDFIVGIWNGIPGFFNGVINGVYNIVRGVIGFIVGVFQAAWNGVVAIWNGIGHFFGGLGGMILNGIGSFGSLLYNAGKDLINGLIHGVTDIAGEVSKTVGNVAHGAINAFKSVLGIHSPSTVFAEAGKNMGEGIKQGLAGTNGLVVDATANLATNAIGAANGAINNPTSGVASVSPTNNTTTNNAPNINLTVQIGSFMGSASDRQALAAQLWQELQRIARQHNQSAALPNIGILPL